MKVNLTINGKMIQAKEGQTILEIAHNHNIIIPTLCYHKNLSVIGSCRLCLVEVGRTSKQVTACSFLVSEGLEISTESKSLDQSRRFVLSLLAKNYVDIGYKTKDEHATEFESMLRLYDIKVPERSTELTHRVNSDSSPVVWVDLNKCILCTRCVRACAEIQGRFIWGVDERGIDSKIIAGTSNNLIDARCESCGACVAFCPTGALDNKISIDLGNPDKKVTTTCTYCGVGCQYDLNVKNQNIIRVTSNPNAPVNGMHLCVKGRYGYDFINHPDRLIAPIVRRYLLDGSQKSLEGTAWEWVKTDWETALNITANNLEKRRAQYGGESIGILTSAKCLNEENYLMSKLARQVLGTNNIDHCARL